MANEGSSTNTDNPTQASAPAVAPVATLTPTSSIFTVTSHKFDPHPVSIKLADDNFLPWKQQAMATIKGYKLQRFLLGAHVIPSRFLSAADELHGVFNEEFLL